jgi:hypothetical protein
VEEPLDVYLSKLRRMADGALRSIDRRDREDPKHSNERQRSWWQGYRQCLDDVEDVVNKHLHNEEGKLA